MAKGTNVGPNVGTSKAPAHAIGAHNFQRSYYDHLGTTGDVRAHYEDLLFSKAGAGGGETIRARGIANAAGVAVGATINAAHFTGRVVSGATVSGALNAVRATLETATTTPGGTLSALQLDSNLVGSSLHGLNSTAFMRVTQSGSTDLGTLMILPAAEADGHSATVLCTAGVDKAATHYIRIVAGSTPMWILATTTAPAHS